MRHLPCPRADVKAEGGEYGNALQAASGLGHEEVVQILLAAGARFWPNRLCTTLDVHPETRWYPSFRFVAVWTWHWFWLGELPCCGIGVVLHSISS